MELPFTLNQTLRPWDISDSTCAKNKSLGRDFIAERKKLYCRKVEQHLHPVGIQATSMVQNGVFGLKKRKYGSISSHHRQILVGRMDAMRHSLSAQEAYAFYCMEPVKALHNRQGGISPAYSKGSFRSKGCRKPKPNHQLYVQ